MPNHFHLLVRIKDNPVRFNNNGQSGCNNNIYTPPIDYQGKPDRINNNKQSGSNSNINNPLVDYQGKPDRFNNNGQSGSNSNINTPPIDNPVRFNNKQQSGSNNNINTPLVNYQGKPDRININNPLVDYQGQPDRICGGKKLHLYFSHLFNAYSKAINKQENRTGSLFQRPFKRIKIDNENYIRQLIIYIHNNPVKHGFTKLPEEWAHSSYNKIVNRNSKIICYQNVINVFEDITNFKFVHINRISLYAEEELED